MKKKNRIMMQVYRIRKSKENAEYALDKKKKDEKTDEKLKQKNEKQEKGILSKKQNKITASKKIKNW